jgi:hypothetical protein
LTGESVSEPPKDAAAVLLHRDLWSGFIPQLGQLTQHISLLVVNAGWRLYQ